MKGFVCYLKMFLVCLVLFLIWQSKSQWDTYFKTRIGNNVLDGLYEEKVKAGWGGKEHVAGIQVIAYIAVEGWIEAKSMEIEEKEWI